MIVCVFAHCSVNGVRNSYYTVQRVISEVLICVNYVRCSKFGHSNCTNTSAQ